LAVVIDAVADVVSTPVFVIVWENRASEAASTPPAATRVMLPAFVSAALGCSDALLVDLSVIETPLGTPTVPGLPIKNPLPEKRNVPDVAPEPSVSVDVVSEELRFTVPVIVPPLSAKSPDGMMSAPVRVKLPAFWVKLLDVLENVTVDPLATSNVPLLTMLPPNWVFASIFTIPVVFATGPPMKSATPFGVVIDAVADVVNTPVFVIVFENKANEAALVPPAAMSVMLPAFASAALGCSEALLNDLRVIETPLGTPTVPGVPIKKPVPEKRNVPVVAPEPRVSVEVESEELRFT
jgi:hypothetical protein